jgi:phosphatidylinositol-3-phosphatase
VARRSLIVCALSLAASFLAAAVSPNQASAAACGGRASQAPDIRHVLLIVMENTGYADALRQPYIGRLASRCGLATNYHAVTHPSLGNYMALTSGNIPRAMRGTDCSPSTSCSSSMPSIFGQVRRWRVWAESMPEPCSKQTTSLYAVRHTAAPYYTRLRSTCALRQIRLGDPERGLVRSLNTGRLPNFGLIAPNLANDMHEGCRPCGDAWLRQWVVRIATSPAYLNGSTAVIITWDEASGPGNHIPLIVVSPYIRQGTKVSRRYGHYALLRAMEGSLGAQPLATVRNAKRGLAKAFGLR